jgi:hypothetical protein
MFFPGHPGVDPGHQPGLELRASVFSISCFPLDDDLRQPVIIRVVNARFPDVNWLQIAVVWNVPVALIWQWQSENEARRGMPLGFFLWFLFDVSARQAPIFPLEPFK